MNLLSFPLFRQDLPMKLSILLCPISQFLRHWKKILIYCPTKLKLRNFLRSTNLSVIASVRRRLNLSNLWPVLVAGGQIVSVWSRWLVKQKPSWLGIVLFLVAWSLLVSKKKPCRYVMVSPLYSLSVHKWHATSNQHKYTVYTNALVVILTRSLFLSNGNIAAKMLILQVFLYLLVVLQSLYLIVEKLRPKVRSTVKHLTALSTQTSLIRSTSVDVYRRQLQDQWERVCCEVSVVMYICIIVVNTQYIGRLKTI